MTPKQAAKIVATLASAYPQARVTEETSETYEKLMTDLDFEATQRACCRLISTSEWMPTIAKIRGAVADLTLGPPRTGGEAWADAIAAVRRVGRYGIPEWEDPLLAEAMRLWGSWRDFCNSPEDDPGGRARFIELYEQLAARKRTDVVSGIALPAPKQVPRLVASKHDRPVTERQSGSGRKAALPEDLAGHTQTNHALAAVVAQSRSLNPMPDREPRRMTAAEIDAALEAR